MAKATFMLQQFGNNDNHQSVISKLLKFKDPTGVLLCSAFATKNGTGVLYDELCDIKDITTAYIGIRNGVTTAQGIATLVKTGIAVYAVDTAYSGAIFHPKIYCAYNQDNALVIIGRANMTFGGLNNNIEASSFLELELSETSDKQFLDALLTSFLILPGEFPNHVVSLVNFRQIVTLLKEGRLLDERDETIRDRVQTQSKSSRPTMPRIDLKFRKPSFPPKKGKKKVHVSPTPVSGILQDMSLVWHLPALKRRHLQIPRGNTNPTGSLSLGQGAFKHIDQTRYFRHTVFSEATWTQSPSNQDKETAVVDFELVVSGITYGRFELQVSHNPKFESGQRNYTSSIHWGDAKEFIAREELLDRGLWLYKRLNTQNQFLIVID